jgi:hypothetical protein
MTTAMALPFTAPAPAERAASERSAGRLLGRLGPDGYIVLPGGIVVGPTGVAVVELLSGAAAGHDLSRLQKRALQVRTFAAGIDPQLPVRQLVGVVGGEADLAERIRSAPVVLAFERVLRLAKELEGATRRWSALPSFHRHRR